MKRDLYVRQPTYSVIGIICSMNLFFMCEFQELMMRRSYFFDSWSNGGLGNGRLLESWNP